jgi:exopolysaccharide biosynthesis polyprenyl glycosylphosphotransferase
VSYAAIRSLRARRVIAERAVIIGGGTVGIEIAKILRDHPEYGLIPAGFVDRMSSVVNSNPAALTRVVRELAVTRIIVAFSDVSDAELVGLLRACASLPVTVHVVPRLFELGVTNRGSHTDVIWGFPLVRVRAPADRRSARITKRVFDLTVGSILLVASLPLFVAAAIAVRLSSAGPVFFRQKRTGEHGRIIEVLKFRTLLLNDDSDRTWSVHGDDRRTGVGRLLRKLSLDEFPQLINVLRGEMSLVGPRPERPYFASRFAVEVRGYGDRHRVPQGITGWAQVHGLRGDTPITDRARFDNYYIENWSIWLDLRILAQTVAAVLIRRGE